jgi:NAD(P)H-binding
MPSSPAIPQLRNTSLLRPVSCTAAGPGGPPRHRRGRGVGHGQCTGQILNPPGSTSLRDLDLPGAFLITGSLLLLVYGLTRAPDVGWGNARTIAEFAGAAALLTVFVVNEGRSGTAPLPLRTFRLPGIASANVAALLQFSAVIPVFFFLTLYMHESAMNTPTVLVTGATGNVGRPLVTGLLADGARVRALTRNPAAAGFPPGVAVAGGDDAAPGILAEAVRGADALTQNPQFVRCGSGSPETGHTYAPDRAAVCAGRNRGFRHAS